MGGSLGGIRRVLAVAAAIVILAPVTAADARAGDLDLKFGVGGIAFAGFDQAVGIDLAVAGDGKIIAAGGALGGGLFDMAVTRFTTKGARDKRFGRGGRATADVGEIDVATHVFLGPGTKVTLVGLNIEGLFDDDLSFRIIAARFTAEGRLDRSFGDEGTLIADPFPENGREEVLAGAALLDDGSLLVAGNSVTFVQTPMSPDPQPTDARPFLARYDVNGTSDPTFGVAGVAPMLTEPGGSTFSALDLGPDGSIIVAGRAADRRGITLWRFLPNGIPDPTFGPGGWATHDLRSAAPTAVLVRGEDYYVAGARQGGGASEWVVGRVGADGALDEGFGSKGIARIGLGGSGAPVALGIHRKRIWVTGSSVECEFVCIAGSTVARLKMNGKTDKRFGFRGIAQLPPLIASVGGIDFRGKRAQVAATIGGGFGGADLAVVQLKA